MSRLSVDQNDNGDGALQVMETGGTLQRVQSPYVTAISVQKKRSLPQVVTALLQEADLSGDEFYYGWSAGKDRIEGPSVDLALAAARCWGNCVIQQEPIQETATSWIFTSIFIDLETGFTLSRQFRQSKSWTVYGKLDEERKSDVRFQIGQSKSTRNVVLNALPSGLINKAMDRAKKAVRQQIEKRVEELGLPGAIDLALKALAKVGVTEDRVLSKFQVASKAALDPEALVIISGDLSAINGGRDWPETLYPPVSAREAGKERLDELKQRLADKAPNSAASRASTPPAGNSPPPTSEPGAAEGADNDDNSAAPQSSNAPDVGSASVTDSGGEMDAGRKIDGSSSQEPAEAKPDEINDYLSRSWSDAKACLLTAAREHYPEITAPAFNHGLGAWAMNMAMKGKEEKIGIHVRRKLYDAIVAGKFDFGSGKIKAATP